MKIAKIYDCLREKIGHWAPPTHNFFQLDSLIVIFCYFHFKLANYLSGDIFYTFIAFYT